MQTSINLQEPYTYSIIPLIITMILVFLGVAYLIYTRKKTKKDNLNLEEKEIKAIPEKNIKNVPVIKEKYLNQIASIEYKYNNKMIELRKAYQMISETIRMFVFEITDITTQNYTLQEIKRLSIPKLYDLIKEFYEPEFASKSKGNFNDSINKARRIINEWN